MNELWLPYYTALILALWQVALHWYLAPLRIFKSTVYCHAISFVRVGAKQQHTSGSVKMLWLKWWFWWMGVLLSLSLLCHLVDYIPQLGKLMSTFNFNLGEYFENVEGNRLPRIFVSTVISRRGFWRWFQLNYFIPYCLCLVLLYSELQNSKSVKSVITCYRKVVKT